MALVKCPECGKEISDTSRNCIHCGYSLYEKRLVNRTEKHSEKTGNKKIAIAIVIAVVMILIAAVVLAIYSNEKIEESRSNITPYIEYIGEVVPKGESLYLESDLYNNMNFVEFMGMKGNISYGFKGDLANRSVNYCSWSSNEGVTEEEFQEIAKDLEKYFGREPRVEPMNYVTGNTYRYFWTDSENDWCVSFGHDLFRYDPEGNIEIMWGYDFCEGLDFYK